MQDTSQLSYVKLSQLQEFTFQSVRTASYKRWDAVTKKFETSQTPVKGFRKIYTCVTDKGLLDLSAGQIGQILEACFGQKERGVAYADLRGAKIQVNNNGQQGMDIRYFFNFRGYEVPTVQHEFEEFGSPTDEVMF